MISNVEIIGWIDPQLSLGCVDQTVCYSTDGTPQHPGPYIHDLNRHKYSMSDE